MREGVAAGQARQRQVTGRSWLASPVSVLVLSGVLLVLIAVDAPLASLAHQSINASGGSTPVWLTGVIGVLGFVLAWRRPRNPLGWMFLAAAVFLALSEDASFYTVADYRLHHGGLPLGWVAVLAQPGWAPAIVLVGLAVLLFPDGALPSPRWRPVLWVYLAVAGLWMASAEVVSVGAVAGHHVRIDTSGGLLGLGSTTGPYGWFGVVDDVFFPVLAVCWLASLAAQAASYRRSSGERRQQLKWLLTGGVVGGIGLGLALLGLSDLAGTVLGLALPASMGVAIFKYRLYDIDRIISRTLAYAIVTGLLVGVYAGLVLLATQVLKFHSTVAVAAATLAAAALFNPVRRRVQWVVDRRFNRARYDADQTVAAFAARLKDAVDLDSIRDDLAGTVHHALEPAHISVWVSHGG
ncbi:MAG TPA: hypothetical protein VHO07_15725 [Streptosporangiaceae bacterium]|nr:hypothetical protein [Streptosporangiaceae bacterium]